MLTRIKLVQNTHCSLKCWYIKPVWYSEENKMLRKIKLVQNTHCSLQCWYKINLAFRRKTNANENQTGKKYTLLVTMLVKNQSGIQKKNKCWQESNWYKIHTAPYDAGIEPVWYSEEKQNANKNQTGTKYTLLHTMLV